ARRVSVPGPRSDGFVEHPATEPRGTRGSHRRAHREARDHAYAAPLLRDALARTRRKYPHDPGPTWPQKVGDDSALYSRGHGDIAQSLKSAGTAPTRVGHVLARPGGLGYLPRQ